MGDGAPRVAVAFPGNAGPVSCAMGNLVRQEPQLPGGFSIGESVYYKGSGAKFSDGTALCFGMCGKIVGLGRINGSREVHKIKVKFPDNVSAVSCQVSALSTKPELPGGFEIGSQAYYTACRKTLPSGGEVAFGLKGEVV